MQTKREHHIDLIKAFAILLVVLGHSIQYTVAEFDNNIAFRFIYSFHMPLFMFISGYLTLKSMLKNDYVIRRFKFLVIPFLMWFFINTVINNYFNLRIGNYSPLWTSLKKVIISPDSGGLWFLWVLFLIDIIYYICQKTQYKYLIGFVTILILYALSFFSIPLWFGFGLVKWHLFFFLLGVYFKEHIIFSKLKWIHIALLLPFLITLECSWGRTGSYSFGFILTGWQQQIYHLLNSYLVAIVLIIYIFKISSLYNKSKMFVLWLSQNTLPIYAIHGTIISLLTKFNSNKFINHTIFMFLLTLIISITTIVTLKRIPYCNYLLFGKNTLFQSKSNKLNRICTSTPTIR